MADLNYPNTTVEFLAAVFDENGALNTFEPTTAKEFFAAVYEPDGTGKGRLRIMTSGGTAGLWEEGTGVNSAKLISQPTADASGEGSLALGEDSYAGGLYSVAMGKYTWAEGDNSTALGFYSEADGEGSCAVAGGWAEGDYSFAANAVSTGDNSFAGSFGTAEGETSTAFGGGLSTGYKSFTNGSFPAGVKGFGSITVAGGENAVNLSGGYYKPNAFTNPSEGANGESSFIGGGYGNDIKLSGTNSSIIGGLGNIIENVENSVILGGHNQTLTADNTVMVPNLIVSESYIKIGDSFGDISTIENDGLNTILTNDNGKVEINSDSGLLVANGIVSPNSISIGLNSTATSYLAINGSGSGIILTSPNGTQYKLTVDDSGNLVTTAV